MIAVTLCVAALVGCAAPAAPVETQPVVAEPTATLAQPTSTAAPRPTATDAEPTATVTVTATSAPAANAAAQRPVIIDTDMASDDWMAILYTLQRPELSVKAITVSGTGEAHCAAGVRNALGLVALVGYAPIPVTCGRETPLQGSHTFPDEWRSGVDGLYGMTLPAGGQPAEQNAVELIGELIASSPEKMTLLTLGPLTNLAETLQAKPELAENIAMVYVMGGAVDAPGNIAVTGVPIDNQVAEWNVYVDPYAAQVVFESGAPVSLVGLDATRYLPLTRAVFNRLQAEHASPAAEFIRSYYEQNPYLFDMTTLYYWDQFTAVVLADESLTRFEEKNVCVVQEEGPQSGRTQVGEGCPAIRVAVSADAAAFEATFVETLNAVR